MWLQMIGATEPFDRCLDAARLELPAEATVCPVEYGLVRCLV